MEEKIIMLRRFLFFLLSFSFLLLSACAGRSQSIPSAGIGSTVTPNPNASASPTPFGPPANAATNKATLQVATLPFTLTPSGKLLTGAMPVFVPAPYTLNVMLDIGVHSVSVDETIAYQNSTGDTLTGLVLAIEPNLWKGCFVPVNLTVNGRAIGGANLNGDRLEIPLIEPLAPDGTLNLFLHFDLHLPPADVYHVFGYNDRQTNLVDWYPFIVPYIPGKGWLLHEPSNVGEHLVYDDQIFDMTLHLLDNNVAVIIAASAPADRISDGWRYRQENVRSFALSASTDFQTASTKADGVTVTSFFFDSESAQGRAVLGEVTKALKTFDHLFGPDPSSSLSIVESPFYDGMEYDGLFFLSRDYYTTENGTVLNDLIDIAVHETAHQWWFGSVGNDPAIEPWLDEALATYSERLFYEQNYPEVNAWQAFRIDAYTPTGWADTDIYHGVDFRTYTNSVYLRGAQFLQALRGRVGEEAFFAFLKDYAEEMAGKRATSADFFHILRQHTHMEISDIVSQYFQGSY